jgi:adenylate cyclase
VRRILTSYDAEEVKTIGDEVMIRTGDPATAVRLSGEIANELAYHGSPPVRVGMHSGPAVHRDDDWFGATVNLASRVADAAKPGEVLLTDETRRLLGDVNGLELEPRGSRYFKHVPELIPVYAVAPTGSAERDLEIDPVCRMSVEHEQSESSRKRRGISYYFCSAECRHKFEQDPRRYIAMSPAARAARRGFVINLSVFLVIGTVHLAGWIMGETSPQPMWLIYAVWAIVLAFHYRLVRRVL